VAVVVVALLSALVVGGCSEAVPGHAPISPTTAVIEPSSPTSSCALGVPGARVFFIETKPGARLLFTAEPYRLDELRRRVLHASAMHGPETRKGEGHNGHHGEGGRHGLQAFQMPPVHTEGSVFENGAFIDFVPVDPADRPVILAKLRERVDSMTAGCPQEAGGA